MTLMTYRVEGGGGGGGGGAEQYIYVYNNKLQRVGRTTNLIAKWVLFLWDTDVVLDSFFLLGRYSRQAEGYKEVEVLQIQLYEAG